VVGRLRDGDEHVFQVGLWVDVGALARQHERVEPRRREMSITCRAYCIAALHAELDRRGNDEALGLECHGYELLERLHLRALRADPGSGACTPFFQPFRTQSRRAAQGAPGDAVLRLGPLPDCPWIPGKEGSS
jgi:hypothetical protein